MSSYCARCGRERDGTLQYCGGCGAAFTEDSAAPGAQGTPADATRADPAFDNTRTDQPAAAPDPFASWYQPQQPRAGPSPTTPTGRGSPPRRFTPRLPGRPGSRRLRRVPLPRPPRRTRPPPLPSPPRLTRPTRSRPGAAGEACSSRSPSSWSSRPAAARTRSPTRSASTPPPSRRRSRAPGAAPRPRAARRRASTPTGGSTSSGGPRQATTPASSPTPSPTLSLVTIGQGVTSSAAVPQVETLLSHFFHGINTHDYAEYASTLNPAQQAKQSQSTFESGYATTTDSGMTLTTLGQQRGRRPGRDRDVHQSPVTRAEC